PRLKGGWRAGDYPVPVVAIGRMAVLGVVQSASARFDLMNRHTSALRICSLALLAWAWSISSAIAQDKGTLDPKPLPVLAHPDSRKIAAKELFGRRSTPAAMQTKTIGFYSKGCLAGGVALPINGETWQVMRLSRNRNWGHPNLISFLERLSAT